MDESESKTRDEVREIMRKKICVNNRENKVVAAASSSATIQYSAPISSSILQKSSLAYLEHFYLLFDEIGDGLCENTIQICLAQSLQSYTDRKTALYVR